MSEIGSALRKELGADRVFDDDETLAAHRVDYWILAHLRRKQGRLGPPPACVVKPRSTAEVAQTIQLAQRHGTAVVPFGGGSGVVGGAVPPGGTIVLDTRDMNRLLELNEQSLYARAEAGMMGPAYEAEIGAKGYTTGHYPQSIALSTVGGWVATRAAGQFSTRYGNIEDLCLGLEAVRASGEVVRIASFPRTSIGPSLRELFLGSEGTLGVITEVTFRMHPVPEARVSTSFGFPGMKEALEASRRVLRVGWRPAVLRAYDATEAHRHFHEDRCVLIALSEGPKSLVAAEMEAVRRDCLAVGGVEIGDEPARHWLQKRNEVPSWDFFIDREMLADTIEVAVTWDRIDDLYDEVRTALAESPGVILASGHSSHGYQQGTNIYFTFVMKPADFARAEEDYLAAWGNAMRATLKVGGTISHHHGIGRLRAPWLAEELGSGYPLLKDLKRALDPKGIMNPGTLLA